MKKENRGITLVALVITIIVLIILAGVSINAVMNKGLIENAKDAKNEFEVAKTEEEKVLSKLEVEAIDAKVEQVFNSNNIEYKFKNTYLTGIEVGTKATELMQDLAKAGYDLYDKEGNQITEETPDTTRVTTGMQIKEGNKQIGTVIIFGDVTFDGMTNADDYMAIRTFLQNDTIYYEKIAMDVNHDGIIEDDDADTIENWHMHGGDPVEQNYEAIGLDELVIKNIAYYRSEYAKELNAKNNGYKLTQNESTYVLSGVESGITVQTLLDALPENTSHIGIKGQFASKLETTETLTAGEYTIWFIYNVIGSDSKSIIATFVVE